jgi:hypothetical protein
MLMMTTTATRLTTTTASATSSASMRVHAIAIEELERVRRCGVDDFDNELRPFVTSDAGAPLRCCLREATAGERIALIAHRPFVARGPYAEIGPVFIHADACAGYAALRRYPEGFRHRRQILRAYDRTGAIVDAILIEGAEAERAIAAMFANPDVVLLHSRNVLFGCYMFAIEQG